MPPPQARRRRGAPTALERAKTVPPADTSRRDAERGDSDRSGWCIAIRFFVHGDWRET